MEFQYQDEIQKRVLLEDETILQIGIPNRKAFLFYRVCVPSVLLGAAAAALLLTNIVYGAVQGLPFSGTFFVIAAGLTIPVIFINRSVQRKLYQNRAYYITDKRILLTGGLFHLKYRTLNYRFIGSVALKRTLYSKLFGLRSYTVSLIMNVNKQLSVKFFSVSGTMLSYLEDPDEIYKLIVKKTVGL